MTENGKIGLDVTILTGKENPEMTDDKADEDVKERETIEKNKINREVTGAFIFSPFHSRMPGKPGLILYGGGQIGQFFNITVGHD